MYIKGANCRCPAGETTQSCVHVHVAGLLVTLAEVTQTACTSQVCVWSRPSGKAGTPQLSTELHFGHASSNGYQPYRGALLDASALVQELQSSGLAVGVGECMKMERERQAVMQKPVNNGHSVLADPSQHLISLDKECSTVSRSLF